MTMKELLRKTKCGFYLSINRHRDVYQSVPDFIEELRERGVDSIDADLEKRMIETGEVYEIHFYPDTPIGFYEVFGTSLDEVVKKAEGCLKANS